MNQDLRKDLGWGMLIGAALAASPLTGAARPGVSLVLGATAGMGVVALRLLSRRFFPGLLGANSTADTQVTLQPIHALLFLCVAAVFAPTLAWLWEQYTFSIWRNAHGLFLPILVCSMIRTRLRVLSPGAAQGSAIGALLVGFAACLAVIDAGARTGYLGTLGLILCGPGLSLLLLGRERTRHIAFPLALLVFMMPIPARLPDPAWLATGTSIVMEHMLDLVNIPAMRHQTFLVLPSGMFNVSTNCGGHAFLYAAVLLAVLLASQTASRTRRVAILLSTWPITVFVNGIRGSVLVGLSNRYGGEITDSFLHGLSGILTFWGVVALVLLVADWRSLLRRASP